MRNSHRLEYKFSIQIQYDLLPCWLARCCLRFFFSFWLCFYLVAVTFRLRTCADDAYFGYTLNSIRKRTKLKFQFCLSNVKFFLPSYKVPFTSFLKNVNLIQVCILLHANEKKKQNHNILKLLIKIGTTPLTISVLLVRRVEYASRVWKPNPFTLEIDILMISLA